MRKNKIRKIKKQQLKTKSKILKEKQETLKTYKLNSEYKEETPNFNFYDYFSKYLIKEISDDITNNTVTYTPLSEIENIEVSFTFDTSAFLSVYNDDILGSLTDRDKKKMKVSETLDEYDKDIERLQKIKYSLPNKYGGRSNNKKKILVAMKIEVE